MRVRLFCMGLALAAILWGISAAYNAQDRRAFRLRAQPVVTFLATSGAASPAAPLDTDATVAARDAAIVPQLKQGIARGWLVNGYGETPEPYDDLREVTPLTLAARMRLPKCAQALIDAGADVNAPDVRGKTPLIWATRCGNSRVIRVLLGAGADPRVVDLSGRTARDYADAYSGSWDNQLAVLIPLKRAGAPAGPYALQKIDAMFRFRLDSRRRIASFNMGSNCDKIPFHADAVLKLTSGGPPIVTRRHLDAIQPGMTYGEVARVMGEADTAGTMGDGFSGTITFQERSRSIRLDFKDAKVTGKSSWGLWW